MALTKTQQQELRQRNIKLEYEIRAARRAATNAAADGITPPPDKLPTPANGAMSRHTLDPCESMQIHPPTTSDRP